MVKSDILTKKDERSKWYLIDSKSNTNQSLKRLNRFRLNVDWLNDVLPIFVVFENANQVKDLQNWVGRHGVMVRALHCSAKGWGIDQLPLLNEWRMELKDEREDLWCQFTYRLLPFMYRFYLLFLPYHMVSISSLDVELINFGSKWDEPFTEFLRPLIWCTQ